jgi:hypothetical protein
LYPDLLDGVEVERMSMYEQNDNGENLLPEYSAAVSLKRIADALEKLLQPPPMAVEPELTEEELAEAFKMPSHVVRR